MEPVVHPFSALFEQLGLPAAESDIRAFITRHRPLPGDVKVQDAPFWTPAQAKALRDMLLEDADWAPVVDQLNLALH
ncbi:Protein of unknown function [Mitsuaria sp. PDC51]|jgi:hypothetical protein|uniref:DUF2789 domain-containing protein n=1 Tax=unclassified Roseateles TaxID=2626991 RepID=UPI0008E1F1A0|nr:MULTISPECIES: DUF2789 domain-containing protein [unclassified Roseateles]MBB3281091.1 hypothetical protein [Mitsuaria sp. BK037]MBB3293154.1 hypothetical protein [Mitsuaria sp. BK041]MBB3362371.1 hypothetical protein [Mitsuaria sp. BK045]SFR79509.1 Protein of unknown function [Mitsuaria sp. PDC51]